MPQNKRIIIAKRRSIVADLKLQGFPSWRIAELTNVSPSQVCNDLKSIQKEWAQTRIQDINEVKERELLKLDLIERKAWLEYERSCDVKTKKSMKKKGVTTKAGQAIGADEKEQTLTEEQRLGDPRYMTVILECISRRAKIVGIEEANKISVKFEDMSDNQLNFIQQKLLDISKEAENLK